MKGNSIRAGKVREGTKRKNSSQASKIAGGLGDRGLGGPFSHGHGAKLGTA